MLSCLLLSSVVLSCLSSVISAFFLYLSLSVCPCDVVCCGVWCVSLWSWCCWWSWCVFGVRHTEKNVEKPVCGFSDTPPCVRSKRPRVYRHHAHMLKHVCAWCRYTRGRFERTHALLSPPPTNHTHTHAKKKTKTKEKGRNHRQYCFYQNLLTKGYHVPQRFTK